MANVIISGDFEFDKDKFLGQGAWGKVYLGRQVSLNRPVAIKVLKKELTADVDFVKRFKREAECLAKLANEHIIQVYSAGEFEGSHFFIMEFVQGMPLSKFVEDKRKFTFDEIAYVGISVGQALRAAWGSTAKIVHRDIKPSNIIVALASTITSPDGKMVDVESMPSADVNIKEGIVKVMDFGLAKVSQEGGADKDATLAGTVIGTPKYISPEQGMGNPADVRSDMYSLGIVLYEMATGQIPFQSESAVSMIRHHIYDSAMPPSNLNPDVPAALDAIIMKCIHKDPNKRYANPSQMVDDLTSFQQGAPLKYAESSSVASLEATMISGAGAVKVKHRKKKMLYIGGAVAAVAIAGTVVWLVLPKAKPPETKPTTPPTSTAVNTSSTNSAGAVVLPPMPEKIQETPESREDPLAKEILALLNKAIELIKTNELDEAKKTVQEALTKAPTHAKAKELLVDVDKRIESREKIRLIEVFKQPDIAVITNPIISEQTKYNYIVSLMEQKKFGDAKEDLGKLIDREDAIVSPGALYLGIRLAAAEKGSSYLSEMDKYFFKLKRLYPNNEFIGLGEQFIKDIITRSEEEAYNGLVKEVDKTKDYQDKTKLLRDFIRDNGASRFIPQVRELLDQVEAEMKQQRLAAYKAAMQEAQQFMDQSVFDSALKSVNKAITFTDDRVEADVLREKIELEMLKAKGIIPLVKERDASSRAFLKIKTIKDDAEMLFISGGEFQMGSSDGAANEKPSHKVTVTPYYIDIYEVTNGRFKKFTDATGYQTDAEKAGKGWVFQDGVPTQVAGVSWRNPNGDGKGIDMSAGDGSASGGDCPVVQISWADATAYAQWAGKRLPTEAEWEKMARGNISFKYPWGNDWSETARANTTESGHNSAVKVGTYQIDKSLTGCFDIIGNISEWCYDYYDETYYQRSPSQDPKGPEAGVYRVIRGGAWINKGEDTRLTKRKQGGIVSRFKSASSTASGFWSNYIGFRCVKDVK